MAKHLYEENIIIHNTWFPIQIKYTDTGEIVICETPEQIDSQRDFKVLSTRYGVVDKSPIDQDWIEKIIETLERGQNEFQDHLMKAALKFRVGVLKDLLNDWRNRNV